MSDKTTASGSKAVESRTQVLVLPTLEEKAQALEAKAARLRQANRLLEIARGHRYSINLKGVICDKDGPVFPMSDCLLMFEEVNDAVQAACRAQAARWIGGDE